MNNEYIKRVKEREESFNSGVKSGIRFACNDFMGNLPCDVFDELIDKTVNFLVDKYHNE